MSHQTRTRSLSGAHRGEDLQAPADADVVDLGPDQATFAGWASRGPDAGPDDPCVRLACRCDATGTLIFRMATGLWSRKVVQAIIDHAAESAITVALQPVVIRASDAINETDRVDIACTDGGRPRSPMQHGTGIENDRPLPGCSRVGNLIRSRPTAPATASNSIKDTVHTLWPRSRSVISNKCGGSELGSPGRGPCGFPFGLLAIDGDRPFHAE